MPARDISAVIERWTMIRRRDHEHDHGSLIAPGAPVPEPDEQLEVFEVVPIESVMRALRQHAEMGKDYRAHPEALLPAVVYFERLITGDMES